MNSEFWNGTLNESLWYHVHHQATYSTNITMIITGTSVQCDYLQKYYRCQTRQAVPAAIMVDMFVWYGTIPCKCGSMMIPGSFHKQDTFRPAIMSTRTSVRSSLTHESGMVCITEPCSAKTRRTNTKLHNSKYWASAIMPSDTQVPFQVLLVMVVRVYSTTTQCTQNIHHDKDVFANNGTGELPSCDSKLLRERASHTSWWSDVLHKTTQCNNKTNDC